MTLQHLTKPAINQWIHQSQRGFLQRPMAKNIVDIEISARALTYLGNADHDIDTETLPTLMLADFVNAFPRLSQQFLWIILRRVGFPPWVIVMLQNLYKESVRL